MVLVYLDESVPEEMVQRVANELWEFCCSIEHRGATATETQGEDQLMQQTTSKRFVLLCVEVASQKRQTWLRNEFLCSKNASAVDPYGMFICGFKKMNMECLQQFITATILPCLPIDEAVRELDNVIWRTTLLGNSTSGVIVVGDRDQESELRDFFEWFTLRKRHIQEQDLIKEEKVIVSQHDILQYRSSRMTIKGDTPQTPTTSFEVLSAHRPGVPSPLTSSKFQHFHSPLADCPATTRQTDGLGVPLPVHKPVSPSRSRSTLSLWDHHEMKQEIKTKLLYATRITCISLFGKVGSYAEGLTADLMSDSDLQRNFSGGIYWIHCGKATSSTEILFQLHHLCSLIAPDEVENIHSIVNGKMILSQLLHKKKTLIILNDVHCYETLDAFAMHHEPTIKYLLTTTVKDLIVEYPRTKQHEALEFAIGNLTRSECERVLCSSMIHDSSFDKSNRLPQPIVDLIDFFQGEYRAVTQLAQLLENNDNPSHILDYLQNDCDMSAFDDQDAQQLVHWKTFMLFLYIMNEHLSETWNEILMLAALPQDSDIPLSVLHFIWENENIEDSITTVTTFSQFGLLHTFEDEHVWIRIPPLVAQWIQILARNNVLIYHRKIVQLFEEYCTKTTRRIRVPSRKSHRNGFQQLSSMSSPTSPRSPRGSQNETFTRSNSSPSSPTPIRGQLPGPRGIHSPLTELIIPKLDISTTSSTSSQDDDNYLTPRSARDLRFVYSSPRSPDSARSPYSPRASPRSPSSGSKTSFILQHQVLWHKIDLSSFSNLQIYLIDYYFRFITFHLKAVQDYDSIRRIVSNYEFIYRKVRVVKEFSEVLLDFERLCEEDDSLPYSLRTNNVMYDLSPSFLANIYQALKDSIPVLQINSQELPFQMIGRLIHLRGETRKFLHSVFDFHKDLAYGWIYPFVPFCTGCAPSGRPVRMNEIHLDATKVKSLEKLKVTTDSDLVIFMGTDSTFHLYNIAKGVEVRQLEVNVDWNFDCTPDGRYLISASYDKTLRKIDLLSGQEVGTFSQENCKVISLLEISPDGKFVFATASKSIYLWSIQKGTFFRLIEFEKSILTVTWDFSCEHLFVSLNDASVIRVKARTGQEVKHYPMPMQNQFLTCATNLARNKKHLFCALLYANTVTQHNIFSGKCVNVLDCTSPVSLGLTSNFLIIGMDSGLVRMVSLHNFQTVAEMRPFTESPAHVHVTPDEQFIMVHTSPNESSPDDMTMKIYDVRRIRADNCETFSDEDSMCNAVRDLFVAGNSIIPVSDKSTLVPHKLDSGRQLDIWKLSQGMKAIAPDVSFIAVAFHSMGENASPSLESSSVQIWDLAEDVDSAVREFALFDISQIVVSAHNDLILLQRSANKILIVNHIQGTVKHEITNLEMPIQSISLTVDPEFLLVILSSGQILIHELSGSFSKVCEIDDHQGQHISATYFAEDRLFVAHDSFVECWTLEEEDSGFSDSSSIGSQMTRSSADAPPTLSTKGSSSSSMSLEESLCKRPRKAVHQFTLHDEKHADKEITCIHVSNQEGVMVCGTRDNCVLVWEISDAIPPTTVSQVAHLNETPSAIFCSLPYIVVGDTAGGMTFIKYLR